MFPAPAGSAFALIARVNPMSYAVAAVRRGLYGAVLPAGMLAADHSVWSEVLVLVSFALASTLLAVRVSFRKR